MSIVKMWMISKWWMISSQEVRASGCQSRSRKSPGFDPSILRHSGILRLACEVVLNNVHKKVTSIIRVIVNDYITRARLSELVVWISFNGSSPHPPSLFYGSLHKWDADSKIRAKIKTTSLCHLTVSLDFILDFRVHCSAFTIQQSSVFSFQLSDSLTVSIVVFAISVQYFFYCTFKK